MDGESEEVIEEDEDDDDEDDDEEEDSYLDESPAKGGATRTGE